MSWTIGGYGFAPGAGYVITPSETGISAVSSYQWWAISDTIISGDYEFTDSATIDGFTATVTPDSGYKVYVELLLFRYISLGNPLNWNLLYTLSSDLYASGTQYLSDSLDLSFSAQSGDILRFQAYGDNNDGSGGLLHPLVAQAFTSSPDINDVELGWPAPPC